MRLALIFPALVLMLSACDLKTSKYPYSISDFKPELRKNLEAIVQSDGLCNDDGTDEFYSLLEKVSDADLEKLTFSEHPLLRAASFAVICSRNDSRRDETSGEYPNDSIRDAQRRSNSDKIDKILLGHLDDTAIITHCVGEWGNQYAYVSDFYLQRSMWKTKIPKTELADEVLRNHNYLNHSLRFLETIPKDSGKYYGAIKQIVNRNNFFSHYQEFRALSIFSDYKKPDDVRHIAERLSQIWGSQEEEAFDLIKKNPDTAYFKILEKYYSILSRSKTQNDLLLTFNGTRWKMQGNYQSFLGALLAYKNKRSADIAADIIKRQLYPPSRSLRKESNERLIYYLLKENECPEYTSLIGELKAGADAYARKYARVEPLEVRQYPPSKNDYW